MIAQRAGTTALRRVAGRPSNTFFTQNLARAVLSSSLSGQQTRPVATAKLSGAEGEAILVEQRLRRPVSPNLEIYDYKQTWLTGSIWTRFTGAGFAGLLYAYAISYMAAPLLGWHLESASLAEVAAGLSPVVKGSLKFLVAWPFTFHFMHGIRHMVQDLGIGYKKAVVISTGWYIWFASIAGSLGLVAFI